MRKYTILKGVEGKRTYWLQANERGERAVARLVQGPEQSRKEALGQAIADLESKLPQTLPA